MAESLPFEDLELAERAIGEPTLHVDVDGFEGPLDLLLELARRQKVDLHRISILALAEQYLVFIEEARKLRLELAADYLVMAAWLAYLKSRLLLPEAREGRGALGRRPRDGAGAAPAPARGDPRGGEAHGGAGAARARRVRPRRAGADRDPQGGRLGGDALRPALGLCPPAPEADDEPASSCRSGMSGRSSRPARRWSGSSARRRTGPCSTAISSATSPRPSMRPTVIASAFSASLELVREGRLALRQDERLRAALGARPDARARAG